MINQCDGCQRGLPLNEFGNHIDTIPGGNFGCTKDRYKNDIDDINRVDNVLEDMEE